MTRTALLLICFLVAGAGAAHGQAKKSKAVRVSSWVTELGAGGGLNLALRGPWMAEDWRESPSRRVLMSVGISLVYEYGIETWNGYTNAARWEDVFQRFTGTMAMELVIGLFRSKPASPPRLERQELKPAGPDAEEIRPEPVESRP